MTRRIGIELFVTAAFGLLLGLLGPFDTYNFGIGPRIGYWLFTMIAGHLILRPFLTVGGWLAQESGLPAWLATVLAITLGSLPLTLLIAWLISGFDLGRAIRFTGLPLLYAQVLLITTLAYWLFHFVFSERRASHPAKKQEATPTPLVTCAPDPEIAPSERPDQIKARLPAGFGNLRALGSEDHYVRAYGDSTTALILIRLRDAIIEVGSGIEGMQVHRSWWVARAAVEGHRSEGRSLRLILTCGLEVPVSRDRIAVLRASGWLKP